MNSTNAAQYKEQNKYKYNEYYEHNESNRSKLHSILMDWIRSRINNWFNRSSFSDLSFNILRFLWFSSELQFELTCLNCILKLIFKPSELCRVPSVSVVRNSPFPFLHSNILISKCISLFKSLVMYYDTGADPAPRFLGCLLVWASPKSSMSHAKRIDLC